MDAERWKRLEQIFQAALECGPEKRTDLLASSCGDDPELRREVESLLSAHEQGGFTKCAFEDGARVISAAMEEQVAQAFAGKRIGAYRVLREIGHGGMGSVGLPPVKKAQ